MERNFGRHTQPEFRNQCGARSPAVRFAAAIDSIGFSKEAPSAGATDAVI